MSTDIYRFRLGDFECACLSDGSWDYSTQKLFANVPGEQLQAALRQRNLPLETITTPYTYLYANTGEHQVLVDMGAGDYLAPRTGKLLHSMNAAGIEPAQIDTVVITHAHPDHIGGALDVRGQPVYANASYYMSQVEWSFWFSDASRALAPERYVNLARRNLEPLRNRMNLLEPEAEIIPGVSAIPAPGHTPGHMGVRISCGKEQLFYIGDTAIHPLHLEEPDWVPLYDLLPEEAVASKHRVFGWAAAEKAWVIGQHFPPFPSLGNVIKNGKVWQWQPIALDRAS